MPHAITKYQWWQYLIYFSIDKSLADAYAFEFQLLRKQKKTKINFCFSEEGTWICKDATKYTGIVLKLKSGLFLRVKHRSFPPLYKILVWKNDLQFSCKVTYSNTLQFSLYIEVQLIPRLVCIFPRMCLATNLLHRLVESSDEMCIFFMCNRVIEFSIENNR